MQEILRELQTIRKQLQLKKKILTLEEFCQYAGISKHQAYHLTRNNKIKFYRPFGKLIFFDIEDIMDFLKQNPNNTAFTSNKKATNFF